MKISKWLFEGEGVYFTVFLLVAAGLFLIMMGTLIFGEYLSKK